MEIPNVVFFTVVASPNARKMYSWLWVMRAITFQQLQILCGHLKALHSWAHFSQKKFVSFCACFLLNRVPLYTNIYCLIIVVCVWVIAWCAALSNFNQVLNNWGLACIQPSMSSYHICSFTTRTSAEYKSEGLHLFKKSDREVREEAQRERGIIKPTSQLWPCVISQVRMCVAFKDLKITLFSPLPKIVEWSFTNSNLTTSIYCL